MSCITFGGPFTVYISCLLYINLWMHCFFSVSSIMCGEIKVTHHKNIKMELFEDLTTKIF